MVNSNIVWGADVIGCLKSLEHNQKQDDDHITIVRGLNCAKLRESFDLFGFYKILLFTSINKHDMNLIAHAMLYRHTYKDTSYILKL